MKSFLKPLFICLSMTLLFSCSSSTQEQITLLEGYWNIDQVTLPDGNTKDFPFSNHMDYFEINGSTGFKHRVSPRYDGTFVNYGSPIPFKWEEVDGVLQLHFSEEDNAYQQTLKSVSKEQLILLHENGTRYTYKAYVADEEQ